MSIPPASLARVPTLLTARQSLANLTRTNLGLFEVETQFSTGRRVNRPSDDAVSAAGISVLDERLERAAQRLRNLDHAGTALNTLDQALGEAHDLYLEAKTIASTQVNAGSSAEERAAQAQVVQSLIDGLFRIANRDSAAGFLFGGGRTGGAPVQVHLGGYRYVGQGNGLVTDLGQGENIPITLGGESALGGTSARVRGSADLDPQLTADTRLADLAGARGLGVTPGTIDLSVNGEPGVRIDLTSADTAGDVADAITAALRAYEADHGVVILGPGGVGFSGGAFTIDLVGGPDAPEVTFAEVGGGVTAQDLGLTGAFSSTSPAGQDTAPRLTWRTPVSTLSGLGGPLGSIRLTNLGRSAVIDLSGAETLEDVRNLIQGADLGVRVEINADGTGIDVLNEVAGGQAQAMSIEEVAGSGSTAARLGIRTLTFDTLLADFNDGRGVRIANGGTDPTTGLPDPARDVDFVITLGDGRTISVDLRPEDIISVRTLVDRINAQAAAQGVNVPAEFRAGLTDGPNGVSLIQNPGLGGPVTVAMANNSPAAEDLGLLSGSYDAATGNYRAEDRARVRVDSLFTALIDLRDALLANDTFGITLAGEKLEAVSERLTEARALVGARGARVDAAVRRTEDLVVLDEKMRSDLRDLDYAEASVRFGKLQLQLNAGLQVAAIAQSRTLLDYLGT